MPRPVDHSKHPAIIDLILAGKTTREIAAELSCSLTTIRMAGCCQQCTGPKADIKTDIKHDIDIKTDIKKDDLFERSTPFTRTMKVYPDDEEDEPVVEDPPKSFLQTGKELFPHSYAVICEHYTWCVKNKRKFEAAYWQAAKIEMEKLV